MKKSRRLTHFLASGYVAKPILCQEKWSGQRDRPSVWRSRRRCGCFTTRVSHHQSGNRLVFEDFRHVDPLLCGSGGVLCQGAAWTKERSHHRMVRPLVHSTIMVGKLRSLGVYSRIFASLPSLSPRPLPHSHSWCLHSSCRSTGVNSACRLCPRLL